MAMIHRVNGKCLMDMIPAFLSNCTVEFWNLDNSGK